MKYAENVSRFLIKCIVNTGARIQLSACSTWHAKKTEIMFTYVLSNDIAVDISVESRSILDRYIGRQPVDSRLTVGQLSVDSQSIVFR